MRSSFILGVLISIALIATLLALLLQAVPVLIGSAAYALGEAWKWPDMAL